MRAKEKMLSLGAYPEVSLKRACDRWDEARTQVVDGNDPSIQRQVTKQSSALTFKEVAGEWFAK